MYALGEPPRTPSEAFDALDNVFSAEEFSASDAEEVLTEVLDLSPSEAQNELRRLIGMRAVVEA